MIRQPCSILEPLGETSSSKLFVCRSIGAKVFLSLRENVSLHFPFSIMIHRMEWKGICPAFLPLVVLPPCIFLLSLSRLHPKQIIINLLFFKFVYCPSSVYHRAVHNIKKIQNENTRYIIKMKTNQYSPSHIYLWLITFRYVTGWFSPYHRKRKKIHPIMIHHFQPDALR